MRIPIMHWHAMLEEAGKLIEVTIVECPRCGLRMSAPGSTLKDQRRCAAMLRAACPRSETNTYALEFMPVRGRPSYAEEKAGDRTRPVPAGCTGNAPEPTAP